MVSASESGTIRVATRGSRLALWQAEYVRSRLLDTAPNTTVIIVPISTSPDRNPETPLGTLGGDKGLFVKEVEQALVDGRADIAVHSLKDVPVVSTPGLPLVAFPQRANPLDVLLGSCANLRDLPAGAKVATSSLRRHGQLLSLRSDLEVVPLRGNIDTRLRKLKEGHYDAMVLAAAGLERLGLEHEIRYQFSTSEMLCNPGQGALAVQCRDDYPFMYQIALMDDAAIRTAVTAERTIAASLDADCHSALGAYCDFRDGEYHLQVRISSPDGRRKAEGAESFTSNMQPALEILKGRLLSAGAREILHPASH